MESLRHKAHTCFEMSARAVSMAFATEEAEEEYHKRIMNVFHEFVKEFVEQLPKTEISRYGLLFTKLQLCLNSPPTSLTLHAQSVEAQYSYIESAAFEVRLKHKELRFRDIMHVNGQDDAVFTLEF